jgi:mannosyltransferase OCH1-like enzyme
MKKKLILLFVLIIIVLIFCYFRKYDYYSHIEIPKIIIQTWKNKDIPSKYHNDVNSIKQINPDYQIILFTDDDIVNFLTINYPEYYKTYVKLPVIIQKIDFFRYIAVYHYGGFYYDLDMTALESLDELLNYECIFPVDSIVTKENAYNDNNRFKKYYDDKQKIILGQYAFGATIKNEFIKSLIDTIHSNIDNYLETYYSNYKTLSENEKQKYVYQSTGPDFVTDVYMNYKNKYKIKILEYNVGQYFGKYAKHNYYGTWKK